MAKSRLLLVRNIVSSHRKINRKPQGPQGRRRSVSDKIHIAMESRVCSLNVLIALAKAQSFLFDDDQLLHVLVSNEASPLRPLVGEQPGVMAIAGNGQALPQCFDTSVVSVRWSYSTLKTWKRRALQSQGSGNEIPGRLEGLFLPSKNIPNHCQGARRIYRVGA